MEDLEILKNLVRIDSQNPPGQEDQISKFVSDYLGGLGIRNEIVSIGANRFNVIAEIGSGDGFILSSHMDTVPVGDKNIWKHDPFGASVISGKLYGRGASDTKSGLASILSALSQLDLSKAKRKLLLLFVADEEVASKGSNWLLENRKELFKGIKYGITTECTDNKIRIAQKGQVVLNVKFNGKAAHGSKPWLGKNAINDAAAFLIELDALSKKLEKKKDPLLGYSTINVGKITGGTKVNIVADRCEISTDNRLIPAAEPKWLIGEYKKIINKLKLNATLEIGDAPVTKAFSIGKNSPLVKLLKELIKTEAVGATGYTEAELYGRALGIDFVSFGPGASNQAHVTDEFVEIKKLNQATDFFKALITYWCL